MLYKRISFDKFEDGNGDLVPIEFNEVSQQVPFDVKRLYFIKCNKGDLNRGYHAHRNLEQVIMCCNGSFILELDDGLGNVEEVYLNEINEAVHIQGVKWRILKEFSEDCLIAVLASQPYDVADYIREYDEFVAYVKDI